MWTAQLSSRIGICKALKVNRRVHETYRKTKPFTYAEKYMKTKDTALQTKSQDKMR